MDCDNLQNMVCFIALSTDASLFMFVLQQWITGIPSCYYVGTY